MKDCCQWWNAVVRARKLARPVAEKTGWRAAAERLQRQHGNRVRKQPKGMMLRNVQSWYEATRRLLSNKSTRILESDQWRIACNRMRQQKHGVAEAVNRTPRGKCPKCRRLPTWVSRCLATHDRRRTEAAKNEWKRKAEAIACGLRNRTKGNSRNVLPKASNWMDGITRAVVAFNAKRSRVNASEWDKWSVNVASNNRKRQRGKQHRKAKRKSDQQSNTSAG